MRSSWRGRSRMTTVMSPTFRPRASAIRPRFSVGLTRMSTLPAATGPTHSFSMYVSGALVRPPASDAARTVIAPAWPWATRFVPSSGSTAMSIAGTSARSAPVVPDPLADVQHRRLVALALADDDRARRTRSRPSSRAWPRSRRASASSFAPRPMNRADSIAAASVTRTISRASSCSTAPAQCRKCRRPGEDHRHVVAVGDLDRHLVADRAARLDDRGDPGLRRELDPVREREVGVATP